MVKFYVRKNDKGLYAEKQSIYDSFALIDRKYLDKVKEGEFWEGEKVREITDRRGRKIAVLRPVRRLLHLNGNDVMCGKVRLCSFEEAKELGIIEEKVEQTPYIPYVGSRGKVLWRMIPTEHGVPENKFDYKFWTVGEQIDELNPDEEKQLREDFYRLQKEVLIDLYVSYKPYVERLKREREEFAKEKEKLERKLSSLEWRQKDYIETLSKPVESYHPQVVVYTDWIPKINMGLGNSPHENVRFGYMYDSETGKVYEYRAYEKVDRNSVNSYAYPLRDREVDIDWLKKKYPNIMEEFERKVKEEIEEWKKEREEMKKKLKELEVMIPAVRERLEQVTRRLEQISKPTREEFFGILAEEYVFSVLVDEYYTELKVEALLEDGATEELKEFLTELAEKKCEHGNLYFYLGSFRYAFNIFKRFQRFEPVFQPTSVEEIGKSFLNKYGFLPKTPQGWVFVFALETSYPQEFKNYQEFAEFVKDAKNFYDFWSKNLKDLESKISREVKGRAVEKENNLSLDRSRSR